MTEFCVAPIGKGGTPCGQPKDADCHTNTTFRHVFIEAKRCTTTNR